MLVTNVIPNQHFITNQIDSIESKNCLTIPSVAKAAFVAIGTIGGYYLAKTTNILSYFLGSKNAKDINNKKIVKLKNEEQSLVARISLEEIKQTGSLLKERRSYDDEKIVEFDEMEVEEFENLPEINRIEGGRRSISIQNPISNQNATVGQSFALTINGNNIFNSNTTFIEATNIPSWMTSSSVNPTFKGSYDTPGEARGIAVLGNYAYVAAYGAGLQIIDISNPINPTFVSSYDTPDDAYEIAVVGNYAYVADGLSGLQIIDVSNKANPAFIGSYDTPDRAKGIAIFENYAYVANTYSGLQIIDITDPANPIFIGSSDTPDAAIGVAILGNYAYIADYWAGLRSIDITNKANPTFNWAYDSPALAYGVAVSGNYTYVAADTAGIQIVDITDPTNPTFIRSYNTPGASRGIVISGNYALVADGLSGLQIIDITDPINPTFKGSCNTAGSANTVTISGNYAYMTSYKINVFSGLHIIKTNFNKLTLSGIPNSNGTYSVDIEGCNEINECITNSFNIIVANSPTDPITNPTDSSNTTVIIVSSVAGTVCIIGLCSLSIIGGIIALRKCRKKKMKKRQIVKKRKIVKKDHCNPIRIFFKKIIGINVLPTKIERKNQIIAENALQPVIQQYPEVSIEHDQNSKIETVPTAPNAAENDVELVDTMHQNSKIEEIGTAPDAEPDLLRYLEEIEYDESISEDSVESASESDGEVEYYEDPPSDFKGPISCAIMKDPYILTETGQTYEKIQIMTWLSKKNTCPKTGTILASKKIIPNFALKGSIEEWQEKHEIKKNVT